MGQHVYESVIGIFPDKYVKEFRQMLIYSDDRRGISEWLGKSLLASVIAAILGVLICFYFDINIFAALGGALLLIILIQFLVYITLYFKVENRTAMIEKALPDALQLIASSLQAGMTPYKAIKVSARKEFGPLTEELNKATAHALGTKDFAKELIKIGDRVDSPTLRRTLRLITRSMHSGGHLATLLEDLSEDIAETRSLKNEMVTNTKTYTMFIMFTIIVGAPLLLSISIHFVTMVQNMQGQTSLSTDEFGLGFLTGEMDITPGFLTNMSIIVLFFTSLLASMLTGVITKGEMKAGLRYAPFVIVASIALFFISKVLIGNFFSGI